MQIPKLWGRLDGVLAYSCLAGFETAKAESNADISNPRPLPRLGTSKGWLFSHSVVSDSETPWTVACQASLSLTISGRKGGTWGYSLRFSFMAFSLLTSNTYVTCERKSPCFTFECGWGPRECFPQMGLPWLGKICAVLRWSFLMAWSSAPERCRVFQKSQLCGWTKQPVWSF